MAGVNAAEGVGGRPAGTNVPTMFVPATGAGTGGGGGTTVDCKTTAGCTAAGGGA